MMVMLSSALDPGDFDHMSGLGWGMMGIGLLVGLTLIGVLAWTLVQATPRRRDNGSRVTSSAEAILADRFARGDIDAEEYRSRVEALRA
jgi:putative membrane protein